MNVVKLKECGYDESALGFSLSYNSTVDRAKEIMPKYAFGRSGEEKFLESICVWLDITAPRYFWQEFDTYRAGMSKQSESTMHTITKKSLSADNFEGEIIPEIVDNLNTLIDFYKAELDKTAKKKLFKKIKTNLPEGFLQRRIITTNYKTLKHIYNQRHDHKLDEWNKIFCPFILTLEHPEFIMRNYE